MNILNEKIKSKIEKHINLKLDSKARSWLAEKGFDPVYGARPLKRFIQKHLETAIARQLISGEISDGAVAEVTLVNDDLIVTAHNKAA